MELVQALAAQVARLGRAFDGCEAWTSSDRATVLAGLDRVAGALATVRAVVLVAEQSAPGSVGPGDRDFTAARARASRTGLGQARREVRQANTLTTLPHVARAVGDGRVPLPHLEALAQVAEQAGEAAKAELARPETQEQLVGLAERQSLREFAATAARLVAHADPAALERSADAQHRQRFFVMSRQPDGVFLKGRLDHLAGEALRTAIAATGHAPDDERTKQQADADALVALAEQATTGMAGIRPRRAADDGALLPDPEQDSADARVSGSANRPTVSVLIPAETFVEIQEAQARMAAGLSPREADAATKDSVPVAPATLEDGTPLSMSQTARILCDSQVGRIVMSAESLPLDLGRTQRLYTGAQRRAVIVRDRACTWNGCDVPATYGEVHHVAWWDRDDGPTSVENGVLLCTHHHHVVHRLDLGIVRHPRPPDPAAPWGHPVRYSFHRRDGRVINAPPRAPSTDTDVRQEHPPPRSDGPDDTRPSDPRGKHSQPPLDLTG